MCGLRNDKTNGETNSPFEYSHCLILFHFVNGNHLFLTKPIITSHLSQSLMISLLIRVSTHDFYHYWGSTSKCHIAHLLYHHSAGKTHYLWQKRATANINFLLPTLPLNDDYLTSVILHHKLISETLLNIYPPEIAIYPRHQLLFKLWADSTITILFSFIVSRQPLKIQGL